jgi:hypothetical protein
MLPAVFAAAGLIGSGYGVVNPVSSHILARTAPPLFGFVVGLAGSYGKAYLVFCLPPALAGLRLFFFAHQS